MSSQLEASAVSAGALFRGNAFVIPAYQREYAWDRDDELRDFWVDLSQSVDHDYFLGLVILTTEPDGRAGVVDGQQRLLTVTMLAIALHRQAQALGRQRLADQIQRDFLRVLDYETDETHPRMAMTDPDDNETLLALLRGQELLDASAAGLSSQMIKAFNYLQTQLAADLANDPFKRMGTWTAFLDERLHFAVFVHADAASAYRVFEVVNERGRDLTPADLLKNHVLGHTEADLREETYLRWKALADAFEGSHQSYVTFIRFVATLHKGYILPKDLFEVLAGKGGRSPLWGPQELLDRLEELLQLYLQMADPTLAGPAQPAMLDVYSAFNHLSIVAARPVLLALRGRDDELRGATDLLKLVVGRIVVRNLGSGGIERRLSEAAKLIASGASWDDVLEDLSDLRTDRDDFKRSLAKESFNKGTLSFLRQSVIQQSVTPGSTGTLHLVRPRRADQWPGWTDEDAAFWASTIGNTVLSSIDRRPQGALTWEGFKSRMLPLASEGEWVKQLNAIERWHAEAVRALGLQLSEAAADVWF